MRRLLLLALSLVLVLLLGPACGGGRKPVAVLAAAQSKTTGAKTSRVAMTIDATEKPGAPVTKITGEGAFDYATRHGTLTMDTAGLGVPGISGNVEIVFLGDVFYMKLPAGLLPGKPWLKLDLASLSQAQGIDLAGLQELSSNDPTANLRFLGGAENVEKHDEVEVRGVATTRYTFVVDLEKSKAKAPDDLKDDIDRLIQQLGTSSYPGEAWVDGDDLIRRLKFTFANVGGAKSSAVLTQEFFDFGVQVDAQAPPADQVSDFSKLLQGAGQSPG
jgi:hypothetical protein